MIKSDGMLLSWWMNGNDVLFTERHPHWPILENRTSESSHKESSWSPSDYWHWGTLGNRISECSYEEWNLRPCDYLFGGSTTELHMIKSDVLLYSGEWIAMMYCSVKDTDAYSGKGTLSPTSLPGCLLFTSPWDVKRRHPGNEVDLSPPMRRGPDFYVHILNHWAVQETHRS